MKRWDTLNRSIAAALLIVAAAATPTAGQTGTSSRGSDALLALVPLRAVSEIEAEMTAADADLARAISAEREATDVRVGARADIDAKKQELAANKERRKAAKGGANAAEITTLEAEQKALEREQSLLEERERLTSVQIDLAHRSGELAVLSRRALELERELTLKRNERSASSLEGTAASSLNRVIMDLEEQTLRAQVSRADKRTEVAALEKQVIDRQLKILAARRRVVIS